MFICLCLCVAEETCALVETKLVDNPLLKRLPGYAPSYTADGGTDKRSGGSQRASKRSEFSTDGCTRGSARARKYARASAARKATGDHPSR